MITIEECKDLKVLKLEKLQNSLVAHEQRLLERKNAEKAATQGTSQRVKHCKQEATRISKIVVEEEEDHVAVVAEEEIQS